MDSSFKNDQLRQLNQRIGYPNEPLRDEYEKETIFEYLYEINKELHSYHDILENIKTWQWGAPKEFWEVSLSCF